MVKKVWQRVNQIIQKITEDHVSAYAAQAAFFLVLSLFPFMILLLTMVPYTPLTQDIIVRAVREIFPKSFSYLIESIVYQLYNQSGAIIPVSIVATFWSAGRGVLAMTGGLNEVYSTHESRGYIFLRIRSAIYTVLFIITIIGSLSMLVFGNRISLFVNTHAPLVSYVTDFIIKIRTVFVPLILALFSTLIYRFLPNHKVRMKRQLLGAVFTAVGWMFISYIFSVYLDIFTGFSDMYGSMTTIVLIMLWLYMCMYIMLLGGELNQMFREESKK